MSRSPLILAAAMLVLGAAPAFAQDAPPASRQRGAGAGAGAIQRFDADRDGRVTQEEYLAGLRQRFAAADANRDGGLSAEELPAFLFPARRAGTTPPDNEAQRMARMLRRHDTNNDGRLSFDEAQPLMQRRFQRMDANRDGVITAEEARPRRRTPANPPAQ